MGEWTPGPWTLREPEIVSELHQALDAIIQYFADHGSTIPSNYIERAYAALDKAAAQRDKQEVRR